MKRPFSGEESSSRERQSPDWRSQKTSPEGGGRKQSSAHKMGTKDSFLPQLRFQVDEISAFWLHGFP
jgi:hypothetical protein